MRYRPELDLVLKDISLIIVCILPRCIRLGLIFCWTETKGEDRYRWENGCWKVIREPLCLVVLYFSDPCAAAASCAIPYVGGGIRTYSD